MERWRILVIPYLSSRLTWISGLSGLKQAWQWRSRLTKVKAIDIKSQIRKWEVANKRCTFRGALWLSQSLKHYWEQNLLLLLAKEEGWRFTLRGA